MISLHNGCWISDPSVNPANWLTQSASVKRDWYIQYYFHDPEYIDKPILRKGKLQTFPNGLLVIVKGMNKYTTLEKRRAMTKNIIADEIAGLKEEGYNPITDQYFVPPDITYEIKPTTPFTKALKAAYDKLKAPDGSGSIKSCLKYVTIAAEQLRFNFLDIQAVRRKHIYLVLEQCEKNNARWSAQHYNHYRAYLMMLFKVLRKLEAIEINPVLEIDKMPITRVIRPTLSMEQRIQIDKHLQQKDPAFRRYIHIFFHSGCRTAELIRMQGKDVELSNQRFKITDKKGKGAAHQEWRDIKDIAMGFWQQAMENCGPEDFVFSRGVAPSKEPVLPEYITKRWKKLIKVDKDKGGLGINIDFYALKHLSLEETAKFEGIEVAQQQAGHATPVITMIYAQGEKARRKERIKKLNNKFA